MYIKLSSRTTFEKVGLGEQSSLLDPATSMKVKGKLGSLKANGSRCFLKLLIPVPKLKVTLAPYGTSVSCRKQNLERGHAVSSGNVNSNAARESFYGQYRLC